jgi:oligoribonuclease NrnB/cAMP/cGMP phosphodiesterase (DHH superfamily)
MESSPVNRPLCIYHGGCDDGFGAAWVVHRALRGTVDFHYGIYQADPPDCTGREVLVVDFSYKRPVMQRMAAQAKTLTILDHHKSAQEDLQDFIGGLSGALGEFDMTRSGAAMTWDWFHPGMPRPWLVEYIQDRDLWRKQLPGSDEVIMALHSYPQDFDVWTKICEAGPDALCTEGRAIHRYYRTIVDSLKANVVRADIGGINVPVVNSPFHFASELAGELAEGEPFAACYWNHAHGTTYSLRSRDGGMDVSQVAAQYGGGGHRGAAGFKTEKPL